MERQFCSGKTTLIKRTNEQPKWISVTQTSAAGLEQICKIARQISLYVPHGGEGVGVLAEAFRAAFAEQEDTDASPSRGTFLADEKTKEKLCKAPKNFCWRGRFFFCLNLTF